MLDAYSAVGIMRRAFRPVRHTRFNQFAVERSPPYFFPVVLTVIGFTELKRRGRMSMPVLESTGRAMARSALRHRPIKGDANQQGKTSIAPVAQRASRLRTPQTEEDEQISPGGASAHPRPKTSRPMRMGVRRTGMLHAHPLLFLGLGMIVMLVLWTLLTLVVSWWNTTWDDIHYGRPRTFQTDAVVGHNDSAANPSHFVAMNLKGHIEVIEFPGGDASKARIYIGPQLYGNGDTLIPVTLSFADVHGNQHPAMILHIQDTRLVFINENGGFRPAHPDELPAVERYLQQHGQ